MNYLNNVRSKVNNKLGQLYNRANQLEKELEESLKAEKKQARKLSKAPQNVSQMLTNDGSSTWNALKLPDNASPTERRIALMTQIERDRLESNLRKSMDPKDPIHKEYLDLFDKYRMK